MIDQLRQVKKWQFCAVAVISLCLLSLPYLEVIQAKVRPDAILGGLERFATQVTFDITDHWNAPVTINKVLLGGQQLVSGASVEATAEWTKFLLIQGISKSEKAIVSIAYAIDFTIDGEESKYRLRLVDGSSSPELVGAQSRSEQRIMRGQKSTISFSTEA